MRSWLSGRFAGYAVGLLAVWLAAGIRLVLHPLADTKAPFPLFLGAVMAAAWCGGLRPGLFTTLLAALAGPYLFMHEGSLTPALRGAALPIGLFVVEGSFISLLAGRLFAARGRADRSAEQALGNLAAGRASQSAAQNVQAEIEILNRLGLTLASELDVGRLVRSVTDAGTAITGAAFGAFLYKDASGSATHHVSGAPAAAFVDFPLSEDASAFGSPFRGNVSRSDDLTNDLGYGENLPFKRMPAGQLPARSYIAAPVRAASGELLGGLFFGHPDAGVFRERDERLIEGLAALAAIAINNAHLYREAQQARAVAEASSRVKDEFLATLSHELRTPLTAIVGWAHLLEQDRLDADDRKRAVETIIRSAAAQTQIVEELLDVSRIITGKLQLELRPVEIGSVVAAAVGTVTPAADAKGIELALLQDPAGSFVMGDPARLQQVFWNILSNAIKFTPKHGRVRVSVQSIGSQVEILVADTGLGIDAAFLPQVFDRFSQEDSSSTRYVRGLGLGLAIARQLVELHGGSIQAASPGLNRGSTFTVRLNRSPVTAAPVAERIYSQAETALGLEEAPDIAGIHTLVVEDDDDARALVVKVLETRGASVRAVSSASEALSVLEKERVDVLLSDIEMPGTDGYQLITELRRRPSQQGGAVPAAALTAYARTEDRLRALRAGFQLHLPKPVHPVELITVVASLAGRRG